MNIPYVMRQCTKCGRWLVASKVNFYGDKNRKYGLESRCKECRNKYYKGYRKANKEKMTEYSKEWRESNPEYQKQWCKSNPEYYKEWRQSNPEYYKEWRQSPQGQAIRFNSHHRRRTKEQKQGDGITKDQWLEMMKFFDWKCAYSGESLGGSNNSFNRTIDHIVPLNSNGDNMIWNCVPMLRSFNSSKCDKDMLEWYEQQEYFSEERLAKIREWQEYAFNKYNKEEC